MQNYIKWLSYEIYIYIYVCMYMQSDIIFVEKCECECKKFILVEKWVWMQMQESWKDELSSLSLAIYVCHPRYFAWLLDYTKRLISYSSFPISFLCLISLFFPCTYTATLHFLLWLSQRNKTQETLLLPFSHGSMQIRNLHLTLLFFS